MSEETIPLKKAARIIAVTWILSLITTLAVVYVVPMIRQPSWHEVVRFTGVGNEESDMFHIEDSHWRIVWMVQFSDQAPEDATFYFDIPRIHTFSFPEIQPSDSIVYFGWVSGNEYLTGSGSYYFEIIAKGVHDWAIIVESYH